MPLVDLAMSGFILFAVLYAVFEDVRESSVGAIEGIFACEVEATKSSLKTHFKE